jgi:hypothetical protein
MDPNGQSAIKSTNLHAFYTTSENKKCLDFRLEGASHLLHPTARSNTFDPQATQNAYVSILIEGVHWS